MGFKGFPIRNKGEVITFCAVATYGSFITNETSVFQYLPSDKVIGCSTWVKRVLILPLLYTFNIHFLTWFDVINAQFSKHPIVCSLKIFDNQTVVFDRVL